MSVTVNETRTRVFVTEDVVRIVTVGKQGPPGPQGEDASLTANLIAFGALADAGGWLHNDGAGALVYSTPLKADVGLGSVPNLDFSNPANITQNATHRFVADNDISLWNSKQDALGFTAVPNTRTVNGHALNANVVVTALDLGLGNVDDTSDVNKPVSIAQQTALDLKANLASPALAGTPTAPTAIDATSNTQIATTAFVHSLITNLIGAAPAALDTLVEIAAQLATDESTVGALTTTVSGKLAKASNLSDLTNIATAKTNLGLVAVASSGSAADLTSGTMPDARFPATLPAVSGANLTGLTKIQVGLTNADNTSDASKPVSIAQQTALDLKANLSGGNAFVGNQTIAVGQTTSAQTDLLINPTTKASGNFVDFQINGASAFSVNQAGTPALAAGALLWWIGRLIVKAPADGKIAFYNNGTSGLQAFAFGPTQPSTIGAAPTHGQTFTILQAEELLTIAAAPTSTTTMLVPAGAIVLSVSTRTQVQIPTAATYTAKIGAQVFNTAAVSTALNSTDPGTAAGAWYNATAQGIVITPNATPGTNAGRVRVTVAYLLNTPATS